MGILVIDFFVDGIVSYDFRDCGEDAFKYFP
jgi:hypothetical protein